MIRPSVDFFKLVAVNIDEVNRNRLLSFIIHIGLLWEPLSTETLIEDERVAGKIGNKNKDEEHKSSKQ